MSQTPPPPPGKPAPPAAPKPPSAAPASATPATPPAAAKAGAPLAATKAETADEAARKEVVRQLRGPVAQTFKALMPELATAADPYTAIMGDAELMDRCFKTFQTKRDAFAAFLVDAQGAPVTVDGVRLVPRLSDAANGAFLLQVAGP